MSENLPPAANQEATQPKWQPVGRVERRVLGVLVEKAKTTPEAYPLTLNALTNGCNQKSNRDPQMTLESDNVEEALENLRHLSAIVEVVGSGRVPKYRHLMYEWMGVDKVEAAIMTELLLRGLQTIGELRGRAARMEPIADVNSLRPILESLMEKRLVLSLTAARRGQLVTHNLYSAEELQKIKASAGADTDRTASVRQTDAGRTGPRPPHQTTSAPPTASASNDAVEILRNELEDLKADVQRLRGEVSDLWDNLR